MRALWGVVLIAAFALPTYAQTSTVPPPYDIQPITLPELMSIWNAHEVWCSDQFKAKKLKTRTRTAHCVYDGLVEAVARHWPDAKILFQAMVARQYTIAARYDHKKINQAQADAASSSALSQLIGDLQINAATSQKQTAEQERARYAQFQAAQALLDAQPRVSPVADFNAGYKICGQLVDENKITSAVAMERCYNAVTRRYIVAIHFPWMDLQSVNEAEHVANGQKFDTGKITSDELIAATAKADADFVTALNLRVAAALQEAAARSDLERIKELRQFQSAPTFLIPSHPTSSPPPPPPPPVHTNCEVFSTSVYCTTQ